MERYQELFHLYVLSGELSKNVSLYYHIGHFCNVNDYLSVMKMLCIWTVETETVMNSIVYIELE